MKTERRIYVSPFPRQNSNRHVFKLSTEMKFSNRHKEEVNKEKQFFEIPPSVTKTYMDRNPLYFDIKHFKQTNFTIKNKNEEIFTDTKTSRMNNTTNKSFSKTSRPKTAITTTNSKLNPINYSYCTVDKSQLSRLLNDDKNLLLEKPSLSSKKDTIPGPVKHSKIYKFDQTGELKANSKKLVEKLFCMKDQKSDLHKNFGVVPEYIHEFKIRQIIEQEYERLLQEEHGYPQGTTKILEIERVNILNKLYKTKDELMNDLAKFPVSSHVRSVKIQNKKSTIEGKLEQIDYAIRIFERNKVFVKNSK